MSELHPIKRALVSVYDKTGLIELGQQLADNGVEIVSTGSTAAKLANAGGTTSVKADRPSGSNPPRRNPGCLAKPRRHHQQYVGECRWDYMGERPPLWREVGGSNPPGSTRGGYRSAGR